MMVSRKSRSKLISFRLTDIEHEQLKNMCERTGESMSNYARVTVLRHMSAGINHFGDDLATIGVHLRALNRELLGLSGQIERALGPEAPHSQSGS
jgi:hypothetical protein